MTHGSGFIRDEGMKGGGEKERRTRGQLLSVHLKTISGNRLGGERQRERDERDREREEREKETESETER